MQFCCAISLDCSVCYEMSANFCPDIISIPVGLVPTTPYYLWVRDFHGNFYYDSVTIETDGSVQIVVGNFPQEIFASYSGPVTVFLSVNADGSDIETFTINSKDYKCANIKTNPAMFLMDECDNYLTDEDGNYLLDEQ